MTSEKSLGQGTLGMCYLAHYQEILVVVKEFKPQKSWSLAQMKWEVFHEARMICHLDDHCGLPLLFGVVLESVPLRLVTQFVTRNEAPKRHLNINWTSLVG